MEEIKADTNEKNTYAQQESEITNFRLVVFRALVPVGQLTSTQGTCRWVVGYWILVSTTVQGFGTKA